MQGNLPNPSQQSFLYPNLLNQLNPRNPLLQLGTQIPWNYFEESFSPLYSPTDRQSKPIRLDEEGGTVCCAPFGTLWTEKNNKLWVGMNLCALKISLVV